MTSQALDRTAQGPGFEALTGMLCAEVDRMLSEPAGSAELARLLPVVEQLNHQVQRAQLVVARQADDACITTLGAPEAPGKRAEYRDTADYLAQTLHISRKEARGRLQSAEALLPRTSLTGEPLPPKFPAAAQAVETGLLPVTAAAQIIRRLERLAPAARRLPGGGTQELGAAESNLVATSLQAGPATMHKVADLWSAHLDPDGAEPSDEAKRHIQGLFDRGRRDGMRYFEIYADSAQAETLLAACSPEANPRTGPRSAPVAAADPTAPPRAPETAASTGEAAANTREAAAGTREAAYSTTRANTGPADAECRDALSLNAANVEGMAVPVPADERSVAQKRLDGLVTALGTALATNRLPRNGGNRPQVMVTIDYQTLLGQIAATGTQRSEAAYNGLITPRHIRRLACDADLIPVVLGSAGQVLDAGRAERLFTEEQRKVLYARDRGCTSPGCTVPVPGCEAHHVIPWSRGGPTDIANGALACPFHHHLVHEGDWEIIMDRGVPYWIPPPRVDASRRPLRNTYFHPELGATPFD
jgi:hypothetical protein